MKIVSLNIWGAHQGEIFYNYIRELSKDTDIFCFQEVFKADSPAPKEYSGFRMYGTKELNEILPDYNLYYEVKSSGYPDPENKRVQWPLEFGLAVFVKNNINVEKYLSDSLANSLDIGAPQIEGLVKVQGLSLEFSGKKINLVNIHGMSRPGEKVDSPARLEQSKKLLKFCEKFDRSPFVICGDFNLNPDTESIYMLEEKFRNLIKEFKIENTRNEISWGKHGNVKQHFADFTFVSKEIKVKNFEVPYNLVSDHLPMLIKIEI